MVWPTLGHSASTNKSGQPLPQTCLQSNPGKRQLIEKFWGWWWWCVFQAFLYCVQLTVKNKPGQVDFTVSLSYLYEGTLILSHDITLDFLMVIGNSLKEYVKCYSLKAFFFFFGCFLKVP